MTRLLTYSGLLELGDDDCQSDQSGRGGLGLPCRESDGRPVRSLDCKVCSSREEALRVRAWAGGGLALRGSGPWFPRDDGWSSCLLTGQGLETAQRVSEGSWMSFLVIA